MENINTYTCPFCGVGKMVPTQIDHEIIDALGQKVVIPGIKVDICDACGEKFYGYEAAETIEKFKKSGNRITLQLNPELQQRIKKLADEHDRSFDEEVNSLLETVLS